MPTLARISVLVSLLATIFYCVVVWYGGNLFAILVGQDGAAHISNYSVWTILPLELSPSYNMIHWQLLALASFLLGLFMIFKQGKRNEGAPCMALPLVNHYGVLLLLTFINISGFGVAFVAVAYVI